MTERTDLHAVIFMTAMTEASIPAPQAYPACLLPMGWASVAERVLEVCAASGLRVLDLVVSEDAERVRRHLGDGARWGVRLNWHLLKDGHTPYGLLRDLSQVRTGRVLLGHGHRWLCAASMAALCNKDQVAVQMEPVPSWTGWTSMPWLYVNAISPHVDAQAIEEIMLQLQAYGAHNVPAEGFFDVRHAQALLDCQRQQLTPESLTQAPGSWIRRAWGLQSPTAHVHPNAHISGPVIVGPGCVVEAKAELGPDTVLSRNVMVAPKAQVRRALVLDDTYISGEVSVEDALVSGSRVQHVLWDVQHVMPRQDALLLPIRRPRHGHRPRSWLAPVLAVLLGLLLLPLLGLAMLCEAIRGRPWRWQHQTCVKAARHDGSGLLTVGLRLLTKPNTGWCGRFIAAYAAGLDVAQRRRAWFGLRPRSMGQWYGLRKDWQDLFSQTPVGVWHAPAWTESGHTDAGEAEAVADAFFAVTHSMRLRTTLFTQRVLSPLRQAQ
ncbi:MAG: hypothetical protein RJB34_1618 [Pseudomonadota bacterium]|jgi:hypothetical protein